VFCLAPGTGYDVALAAEALDVALPVLRVGNSARHSRWAAYVCVCVRVVSVCTPTWCCVELTWRTE
jgi:hypothetical protein